MRYFALAAIYMTGLAGTLFLIERDQPYWAGALLFLAFLLLVTYTRNVDYKLPHRLTFPYISHLLMFLSSLAASVYLITQNSPYWAGGILFFAVILVAGYSNEVNNTSQDTIPSVVYQ